MATEPGDTTHDRWGVPHVRADSLPELAFRQGREAMTTRAWQLELEHRRGLGTAAALLGPAAVEWDTFAHRARIAATARAAFAHLDAESQAFVAAYADGVNAALDDGVVPGENRSRDVAPQRWEPWSSLAVFWAQNILFANFPDLLWERRVSETLGPAATEAFRLSPLPAAGSNALGLTGDRTASGLPLVAGDPHRLFEVPNVYAQVRLTCEPEGVDVVGFTFPGVPGVQHFAHAGEVAWAITNAMADTQDVHVVDLGDLPAGTRSESVTLDVRDDAPVEVELLHTPTGPVVLHGGGAGVVVVLHPERSGDLGGAALLPLLRARTAADVEAAFGRWVEPVDNVVVADTTGEVRHFVAGAVPRASGPLPRIAVEHGRVVTANDRATPAYDDIGDDFAPPWRANRIRELLDQRDDWTAAELPRVLLDDTIGPALLDRVLGLTDLGEAGRQLQQELAGWDRRMRADSLAAGTYAAVREELVELVVASDALAPLREPCPWGALLQPWFDVSPRVLAALESLWRAGPTLGLDLDALLRTAVETAAAREPRPWGDRHRFAPLSGLELFALPDERPEVAGTPLDGDGGCVAATSVLPGTDACIRGPVARYVWDLADRDRSRWAVPLGAWADPAGPHATDQFPAWRSGALLPVTDPPTESEHP